MSFYNFVPLRKMKINNITKQNIYNNDKKSLYKQKKITGYHFNGVSCDARIRSIYTSAGMLSFNFA